LADCGEAVGVLGVADAEGFVEAVDVGAVLVGDAPFLGVAAQADVPVGDGEQGLSLA
jgi:hypothetical protein